MSLKPQLAVLAFASFVVASIYALVLAQAPLERPSRNESFVSGWQLRWRVLLQPHEPLPVRPKLVSRPWSLPRLGRRAGGAR